MRGEESPRTPPRHAPFPGPGRVARARQQVVVETRLTLEEHRYLADHVFVNARPTKPVSACLPVVPLTMTLEMLAEVAACLAPGMGLLGFETVRAQRWIAFEDQEALVVRLEAQVASRPVSVDDGTGESVVVDARVLLEDQVVARAKVVFGPRYRETCRPAFHELEDARALPVRASDLYDQGFLFHGPRFRCLATLGLRGRQGITGELDVLGRDDLFASDAGPQLLLDPVVLDGAGQLLGAFFHGAEGYVLPVAMDRIEFYRPPPDPGARCPARVEFTKVDLVGRRTSANLEVEDGQGSVWFRIEGWQDVVFPWKADLLRALRQPERHTLARPRALEGVPDDAVATLLEVAVIGDIQLDWLARGWLSEAEWPAWREADGHPGHRRQWLMGRIAAKDAVRTWLARHRGEDVLLHPARITLANEAGGRPFVRWIDGSDERPHVTLTHVEAGAAAAAWQRPIGIDLARQDAAGALELGAFTSAEERDRLALAAIDAEADVAWRTRVWCAKEAAGKLLGTGLAGRPRTLDVVDAQSDGQIAIVHTASGHLIDVHASLVGELVVAVATSPQVALPASDERAAAARS